MRRPQSSHQPNCASPTRAQPGVYFRRLTVPAPALSVVVRVVGGGVALRRCLERLIPQIHNQPIEVVVPYDSTLGTMAEFRRDFPQVRFVDMGVARTHARAGALGAAHELYDLRTSRGLLEASGNVVALVEDYGAPAPDWCAQVLTAHALPHGVIGGAVEHEGHGPLNWAVFLLDFGRYQRPLLEGPAHYLTDVNVSYKRDALELVKSVWAERYNEVTTHWALADRGVMLWLRPQMVVGEDRGRLAFAALLRERVAWGRLFGATRARQLSTPARLMFVLCSPILPFVLVSRLLGRVFRGRRNRANFVLVLPYVAVVTVAWCIGECLGYITGREFE